MLLHGVAGVVQPVWTTGNHIDFLSSVLRFPAPRLSGGDRGGAVGRRRRAESGYSRAIIFSFGTPLCAAALRKYQASRDPVSYPGERSVG